MGLVGGLSLVDGLGRGWVLGRGAVPLALLSICLCSVCILWTHQAWVSPHVLPGKSAPF
jgi:hypothetical protein